jgi:hypothetical protein
MAQHQRIALSAMIGASRDCGWTRQLHPILNEKLSDADIIVFNEWLKVAEEQKRLEVRHAEKKGRGW